MTADVSGWGSLSQCFLGTHFPGILSLGQTVIRYQDGGLATQWNFSGLALQLKLNKISKDTSD